MQAMLQLAKDADWMLRPAPMLEAALVAYDALSASERARARAELLTAPDVALCLRSCPLWKERESRGGDSLHCEGTSEPESRGQSEAGLSVRGKWRNTGRSPPDP